MTEHDNATGDQHEHLNPRIYRDLAKLGWKIPETEVEVQAAEEWAEKPLGELPARLHETQDPNKESAQRSNGILGRYLREAEQHRSLDDSKAKDARNPKRDNERG